MGYGTVNLGYTVKKEDFDPAGSAAAVQENLTSHVGDKNNPHGVTAAQVGADPAGSAEAVQESLTAHMSDKNNPHSVTAEQVGADPAGSAAAVQGNLDAHTSNHNNPHGVTAAQVGLGNVNNTADADKPISTATQAALDGKANSSHNHSASNITSGTFSTSRLPTVPITKGGTGATSVSGALSNLGAAAADHTHPVATSTSNGFLSSAFYKILSNTDAYCTELHSADSGRRGSIMFSTPQGVTTTIKWGYADITSTSVTEWGSIYLHYVGNIDISSSSGNFGDFPSKPAVTVSVSNSDGSWFSYDKDYLTGSTIPGFVMSAKNYGTGYSFRVLWIGISG